MKLFLTLCFMMVMGFSLWGAEGDAEVASNKMDQSLDDFENESDEEAFDSLRKKAAAKRAESDARKKKEDEKKGIVQKEPVKKEPFVKAPPLKKEPKLQDSNTTVNRSDGHRVQSNYAEKSNTQRDRNNVDDTTVEPKKKRDGFGVVTVGAGFGEEFDNLTFDKLSVELGFYSLNSDGQWMIGASLGAGFVEFDEDNVSKPYVSFSLSALMFPMGSGGGLFLRGDVGVFGWGFETDEDDDDYYDDYDDEYYDDDREDPYLGLLAKGGIGFLAGDKGNKYSLQLLYSIHTSEFGTNKGIEVQFGFHF